MEDMINALLDVVRAQHTAAEGTDTAPFDMDDIVDMALNILGRPDEEEERREVVGNIEDMVRNLAPDIFPPKTFEELDDQEKIQSAASMIEQSLRSGTVGRAGKVSIPRGTDIKAGIEPAGGTGDNSQDSSPYFDAGQVAAYMQDEEADSQEEDFDPHQTADLNDLIYNNFMQMMGMKEPQVEYPFDRSQVRYGREKTMTEMLAEEEEARERADREEKETRRKLSAWELAQNAVDKDEAAHQKEEYIPKPMEMPSTKSASQMAAEAIARSREEDNMKTEVERRAEQMMEEARKRGMDPMAFALHQQEILRYMEKNSDELVSFEDFEDLSPEEKYEIEQKMEEEKRREAEASMARDQEAAVDTAGPETRTEQNVSPAPAPAAQVQDSEAGQEPAPADQEPPALTEEMLIALSQEVLRENADMILADNADEDMESLNQILMENIRKMMAGSGVPVSQDSVEELLDQVDKRYAQAAAAPAAMEAGPEAGNSGQAETSPAAPASPESAPTGSESNLQAALASALNPAGINAGQVTTGVGGGQGPSQAGRDGGPMSAADLAKAAQRAAGIKQPEDPVTTKSAAEIAREAQERSRQDQAASQAGEEGSGEASASLTDMDALTTELARAMEEMGGELNEEQAIALLKQRLEAMDMDENSLNLSEDDLDMPDMEIAETDKVDQAGTMAGGKTEEAKPEGGETGQVQSEKKKTEDQTPAQEAGSPGNTSAKDPGMEGARDDLGLTDLDESDLDLADLDEDDLFSEMDDMIEDKTDPRAKTEKSLSGEAESDEDKTGEEIQGGNEDKLVMDPPVEEAGPSQVEGLRIQSGETASEAAGNGEDPADGGPEEGSGGSGDEPADQSMTVSGETGTSGQDRDSAMDSQEEESLSWAVEDQEEPVNSDQFVLGEHTQAEIDEAIENLDTLGLEGEVYERAKRLLLVEMAGSEEALDLWLKEQEEATREPAPRLEDDQLDDIEVLDEAQLEEELKEALDDDFGETAEEESEKDSGQEESASGETSEPVSDAGSEEEQKDFGQEDSPAVQAVHIEEVIVEDDEPQTRDSREETGPEEPGQEPGQQKAQAGGPGSRGRGRKDRHVVRKRDRKASEKTEQGSREEGPAGKEQAGSPDSKEYQVSVRSPFVLKNSASFLDKFEEYIVDTQENRKLSTGFKKLDSMLRYGLHKGSYFIDAEPQYLKNGFMQQIADHSAESGVDVLYISTELSRYDLMVETISRLSYEIHGRDVNKAVSPMDIMTGQDGADLASLKDELNWYRGRISEHLFILDQEAVEEFTMDMEDVSAGVILEELIRSIVREGAHKPVVFIDNIENILSAEDSEAMKPLMEGIRMLARELGIPIIMSYGYAQAESEETLYPSEKEFHESLGNMCDVYMELQYADMVTEDFEELSEDDILEMMEAGDTLLIDIYLKKNRRTMKASCQIQAAPKFNFFEE